MDLWEATKILFRRWYITVPICVLAVAGAYAAGSQMDPEYIASTVGILLPIDQGGESAIFSVDEEENPWETAGPVATLRSVSLVLIADDVRGQVVEQGLAPTYSIEVEPRDPIVYIDVTDRNGQLALSTLDEMILRFEDELDDRQSQVQASESRRYRLEILSQSEVPLPDYSSRSRIRIIVLLLGIVAAAAAGLIFDAWAVARKERREREDGLDDEIDDLDSPHVASDDAPQLSDDAEEYDQDPRDDDQFGEFDDDLYEDDNGYEDDETVRAPVTVGAGSNQLRSSAEEGQSPSDAPVDRRSSGAAKRR